MAGDSDVVIGLPPLTHPVFVGGVSRSGTTVVGKHLLGRHAELACTIPAEMWFLTDAGGLCDMSEHGRPLMRLRLTAAAVRRGHASPRAAFRERMEGFWYRRRWWKDGREKGLFQSVDPEQLQAALSAFEGAFAGDPRAASRQLAADLIDPSVRERGKRRWVDTTPRNVRRSDALIRLFPDLRLVHMIRDGRDVAASIVSRPWGTDDVDAALTQWYDDLRAGHAASRAVPEGQQITIQLERLVGADREQEYARLLRFLQIEDSPRMRRFFDRTMSPEAAHQGRWSAGLDAGTVRRLQSRYDDMLARLDRDGIPRPQ